MRKKETEKDEDFLALVREQLTEIYLIAMLAIYPLTLGEGYGTLVYKKWDFFRYTTAVFVVLSLIFGILQYILKKQAERKKLNRQGTAIQDKKRRKVRGWPLLDFLVLGYAVCTLISYAFAVDKETALWGVDTWYMGLVTQLLLVGIYFGVSGGYLGHFKYLKYLCAVVGAALSGIVILQRFGVDVMHLYEGYGAEVRLDFVTTLGQVTWTSGYLSILLAAGIGIYYLTERQKQKIFWGCCIGIGFGMEAVLNCDSGVIAVVFAMMLVLWTAIGKKERILRFAEIVMIALAVIALIGLGERIWAERIMPIDNIYLRVAQSPLIYVLLAAFLLFWFLVKKDKIHIRNEKKYIAVFRGVYLGIIALGAIFLAILFWLHGKGYFAGSPTENYFRFTVWWGNSRGFIWRTGAAVFGDFPLLRKLFGCGPDCFTPYAYQLMGDAINEFWHNQLVPNVHNEWFNATINYGIVGGAFYLGIFLSASWKFLRSGLSKMVSEHAELFGIGLAAAAYVVHNILCYQQIIAAPALFLLLGLGTAVMRRGQHIPAKHFSS